MSVFDVGGESFRMLVCVTGTMWLVMTGILCSRAEQSAAELRVVTSRRLTAKFLIAGSLADWTSVSRTDNIIPTLLHYPMYSHHHTLSTLLSTVHFHCCPKTITSRRSYIAQKMCIIIIWFIYKNIQALPIIFKLFYQSSTTIPLIVHWVQSS